ncbi:hypothetical protein Ping_2317 [Psychromonas ingrahamii 37]|uniref:DUF3494 domain-containing protein n=1 Tax=Psychromonas ingrahamii (strain DSM 17664 / CCUG 51855 / 37) TaxID=357804 RepID=A1SX43_PSYIN|nr:ice-binding family protein [Psychromonas ingrahamii]ABM04058.1 hypothetical protein Ping_2317 [Psychromonas ingrahamii 37]
MKNVLLKTCLTGLALSVAGLANAQDAGDPVKIFTPQLISHAAISGAALSISADSVVDGDLAAKAAIAIGAGKSQTQEIYAGAAVATGALSRVKHIFSGAATAIGAGAHAQNIAAGAAITLGAGADVNKIVARAAITLGAGATNEGILTEEIIAQSAADGKIRNFDDMVLATKAIEHAQRALTTLNSSVTYPKSLYTTMGSDILAPGIYTGSALSIAANSTIYFDAGQGDDKDKNHVWVINLSEALTVGADTQFKIENLAEGHTANVIWNVGAAVTLGAGTQFLGTTFAGGAFNAATSNVSCGNIYAGGAVSVGSIGTVGDGSNGTTTGEPVACNTNAQSSADFTIADNEYSFAANSQCSVWTKEMIQQIGATSAQIYHYYDYNYGVGKNDYFHIKSDYGSMMTKSSNLRGDELNMMYIYRGTIDGKIYYGFFDSQEELLNCEATLIAEAKRRGLKPSFHSNYYYY